MRLKILGASIASLIVFAACAAPAGAVVANTAGGRVSYVPLNESPAGNDAVPQVFTMPTGHPPLIYHGGPVMHSQTAYAIFWAPSGYSFPSGYKAGIENFLQNVGTDSGEPSNVYSVSAQYEDGTGHASYVDSFGGSTTDTTTYPVSGTCPSYTGLHGETYSACISNEKLEDEVHSVVAAKSWPTGLAAEYYVVLPPHAGSCFGTTLASGCFDASFCAYHSYTGAPQAIYANISYSPGDVSGCGVGEYPNGTVDDTLSSLSHEANESMTDPLLSAWYDSKGYEDGDECRNSSDDYGTALGGTAGSLFNQAIASGHYYLQQEWSNDIADCAQRVGPAVPAIADPGEVEVGEEVSFDGSGTSVGDGGIDAYRWDFGDGTDAGGETPTHTFSAAGAFTVSLTVEDDGGFEYSAAREVTVTPHLPPQLAIAEVGEVDTGAATLSGSVDPEGHHTTYRFEYGTSTSYGSSTPSAIAGSGLAAEAVAARLTGLAAGTTYHYRLVAQNAVGQSATPDAAFTTTAELERTTSSSSLSAPSPPGPSQGPTPCIVPPLIGKTLGQARSALGAAHCRVGKVKKLRASHGRKLGPLVVVSSLPGQGADAPNGAVDLTLGHSHKPKHHHHR